MIKQTVIKAVDRLTREMQRSLNPTEHEHLQKDVSYVVGDKFVRVFVDNELKAFVDEYGNLRKPLNYHEPSTKVEKNLITYFKI